MTGPGIPISTLFENHGDRGTANILPISEQLLFSWDLHYAGPLIQYLGL